MMARQRAILALLRTEHIPARDVKWSEFCDLVRAVAKIEARQERFPRGWSNAAIMSSAKKLDGGSTMLCLRCKNELASENALDAEPDVDRWRRELVAGGERRVLSPTLWALFDALYAGAATL
jgi:hypothetical protein